VIFYGKGEYTYKLQENWAQIPGGSSFIDVCSIAVDDLDRVFVFNRSENPIMVFDHDGKLLASWGKEYFKRPHGSCISADGSIFCTDDVTHIVTKFSGDGRVLMTLGNKDRPSDTGYRDAPDLWERISSIRQGGPPFNKPTGVALSSNGQIYVSDGYGNARVHKFSEKGELLFSWGEPGSGPGQFRLPHEVRTDKEDRVWVPDRENSRIQVFDDEGRFLSQWTDLIRPTDLFIDDSGTVFVSELCSRISIFGADGNLLTRWGNEKHSVSDRLFVAPHAIAVDSEGSIYVGEVAVTYAKTDRGLRTIQKFIHQH
jgi:DNA-binding beta-propeller fold protein YncE